LASIVGVEEDLAILEVGEKEMKWCTDVHTQTTPLRSSVKRMGLQEREI
jgi:hypothetical protein